MKAGNQPSNHQLLKKLGVRELMSYFVMIFFCQPVHMHGGRELY